MTDFDPLTSLDRAIIAAAQINAGAFTMGAAPDKGGWIRNANGLVFRGVDVSDDVIRLTSWGYSQELRRTPLVAKFINSVLNERTDPWHRRRFL